MKRFEGEKFEDYKTRRSLLSKAIRNYCKGRIVWLSSNMEREDTEKGIEYKNRLRRGTYVKKKHGPIKSATMKTPLTDLFKMPLKQLSSILVGS